MKLDYKLTDSGADALRTNIIRQMSKRHQHLLRKRGRSIAQSNPLVSL